MLCIQLIIRNNFPKTDWSDTNNEKVLKVV